MRCFGKAAVAVIVTIMFFMPLDVAGTDAVSLTAGSTGVSFEADSVDSDAFNALVSDEFKTQIAYWTLDALGTKGIVSYSPPYYDVTDLTVGKVYDIEMSVGGKVTDDSVRDVSAKAIECDISFTATCTHQTTLFQLTDGTQDLYKALPYGNIIKVGSVLKVQGTVTVEESKDVYRDIIRTDGDDYLITKTIDRSSESHEFSGIVEYTYAYEAQEYTRTLELDTENAKGWKTVTTYDFYEDDLKKVVADTEVISTTDYGNAAVYERYGYGMDDVKGHHSSRIGYSDLMDASGANVRHGTADSMGLLMTADIEAPVVSMYKSDGTPCEDCLFNDDMLQPEYRDEDKLTEYLDSIGSTGDSFSSAEDVADSVHSWVRVDPGPSLVIFYVAILVLITFAAALLIIMRTDRKKKQTN